jgi:23S rRNA pseudouridine2605 synthase
MRNERGPKKTGRSNKPGFKGKPAFKKEGDKKQGGFKKSTGARKFGSGFKKDEDRPDKKREDKPERKFSKDKPAFKTGFKKKPFAKKEDGEDRRFSKDKPAFKTGFKKKPFTKKEGVDDRKFSKDKPAFKSRSNNKDEKREDSPRFNKRPYAKKEAWEKKETDATSTPKKSGSYKEYKKKGAGSSFEERKEYKRKTGIKTYTDKKDGDKTYTKSTEIVRKKDGSKGFKKTKVYTQPEKESDGLIRLNKFIANAGICSRREADTFIETGVVTVNGVVITELGYKVKPDDKVLFHDRPIIGEKHVYILLNKPKDYITTSKDPQNRKTIYELVSGIKERVFPIGRLDRNTTGVLLLTNDGQLAEKLMHPRKGITKIYHAELDKKFTAPDMADMKKGIELEDGFFAPDVVDYVEGMDKHHVGIEIHSGANRIVRRLFEALQYDVIKLDRVVYAGLTKKGLTRGKWRFLKDTEVYALKMM